jgi:hypothetical protein
MAWQLSPPDDHTRGGSPSHNSLEGQNQRGAAGSPATSLSAGPSRPGVPFQEHNPYRRGPSPSYSGQSSYPGAPSTRASPLPHASRSSPYEASRFGDYPHPPPTSSYGSPHHQRPQAPHHQYVGPPPPQQRPRGPHQQYPQHYSYTPQGPGPLRGTSSSPVAMASIGSSQGSPIADAYKTAGCTCKKSR